MKIKKAPSKKLSPLSASLQQVIKQLEDAPEEQLVSIITEQLDQWTFSRGDLFHWVTVLNRFDTILERLCQDHKLDAIQRVPFQPAEKQLILAILQLCPVLFEHCTNRNIFNSYEHLSALLNTSDVDILEAVLRFMLRPAQRVTNPRAMRSSFVAPQEKIIELAKGWPTPDHALLDLCNDRMPITEDMTTAHFQFYRTSDDPSHPQEGVQVIACQLAAQPKSDIDWFQSLVDQYNVPKEHHFELFNRVRIANNITNPSVRKKMLICQLAALTIMAHTATESTAQNKVFVYEPHLIPHLAETIQPEKAVDELIQTYALYAMDGIARHRSQLTDVLQACNASANHGPLLHILRQINQASTDTFDSEFLDALFTLLLYMVQTPSGSQILMSAGIIPILLGMLDNQESLQIKSVTKVVGLLDGVVNAISASFSAFCNANGVEILLNRIKTEVHLAMEYASTSDSMDQNQTTNTVSGQLAYERISLIKVMLRFLIRMMESTGTSDGLRNLIDSSAPVSLRLIISHPKTFGNSVFTLAVNVASTFIHNEPTSLAILQEQKLPQAFLDAISHYETPNLEVMVAAIHAFGAICLNGPGLQMFNDINPLPHFFDMLTHPDYLRSSNEVDGATGLGNAMDELVRHHPSLRPEVFRCVITMVKKVLAIGNEDIGKPTDNDHLLRLVKTDPDIDMDAKPDEKFECLTQSFIDLVARFLEGLFQNQANIREFVKDKGPEMLLDYFALPNLPSSFSVSIAFDSLTYLLRLISEVSPIPTVLAVAEKARASLKFILDDNATRTTSMVRPYIDVKDNEQDKIGKGNDLLHKFIVMNGYVSLLANLCCSSHLAHGKNGIALVNEFVSQGDKDNIIILLGELHRTMVWENILLRESVPKSWYNFKSTKKPDSQTDNPLGITGVDGHRQSMDGSPAADSTTALTSSSAAPPTSDADKDLDSKDPRIVNIKHFKIYLTEIPLALTPFFQLMSKVTVGRRNIDSTQIRQAFKWARLMTKVLMDSINWPCIEADDAPPCKYNYLASMFSMTSMLLLDDRTAPGLNTPLAVTYDRQGGVKLMTDRLDQLWQTALSLQSTISEDDPDTSKQDVLHRINSSIELLLAVLANISSTKLLMDSPFTFHFTKKDHDAPDYFESRTWNISVSVKVADIRKHLHSKYLYKAPKFVLRMLFKCLSQIIASDMDKPKQDAAATASSSALGVNLGSLGAAAAAAAAASSSGNNADAAARIHASLAASMPPSSGTTARPPVVPNEAGVQTLVDMGFNRAGAEQAMIRCNNHISRAVDYLFSHPMDFLTSTNHTQTSSQQDQQEPDTDAPAPAAAADPSTDGDQPPSSPPPSSTTTSAADQLQEDDQHHEDDEDEDDAHSDMHEDEDEEHEDYSEDEELMNLDNDSMEEDEDDDDGEAEDEHSDNPYRFSLMTPGNQAKDKGKIKATEDPVDLETFKAIRQELRDSIPTLLLPLLDERDDVLFEVHDLLLVICKFDTDNSFAKHLLTLLVDRIQRSLQKEKSESQQSLCRQLRLLALLLRDPPFHRVLRDMTSTLACLFDLFTKHQDELTQPDQPTPAWLASALLVLEMVISIADEPTHVKLTAEQDQEGGEPDKEAADDVEMQESEAATLTLDQRSSLLESCVAMLKKPSLSKDDLYAILRVLVRLTKSHDAAMKLVELGGLDLLFSKPRSSLEGFQGQQAFIVLILRHVIEDRAVLEEQIEDIITTWGTVPRPRNLDVQTFFRNNAAIALRNPDAFLRVSEKICRLTRYSKYDRNRQIKVLSKEDQADAASHDQSSSSSTTPAAAASGPEASTGTDNSQQPASQPQRSNRNSSTVISHLLNELLATRAKVATDEKPTDLTYAYTGFLLQCLVELVSSYPSCKYDMFWFSRHRGNKDGAQPRPRHAILNLLINDLLPHNAIKPGDDESRKQQGISMWTSCVLVAMCYNTLSRSEDHAATNYASDTKYDLNHVRKYVLEGIVKAFKDLTQSTAMLSAKYNKYLSLADLCHRVLNARPNPGHVHQQHKEDASLQLAKIMLDKGFVGVMTSAISDVDVNYPHAKTVLGTMIRPLEQLTKLAVTIERKAAEERAAKDAKKAADAKAAASTSSQPTSSSLQQRALASQGSGDVTMASADMVHSNSNLSLTSASSVEPADDDDDDDNLIPEHDHDHEDTPDLYRHSSLGMFNGSVMDEDEDHYDETDEEGVSFDEEEFDDETGSDLSDMSEEDGDEDGDQEMEVVLRHYETDEEHEHGTDESGDESDEDESDEDDAHDHDTDDEDDGHAVTWRFEDMDDEGVFVGAEITIESDEEEPEAHRHHRGFDESHENDLDTLDQSDFDEEEGSEGYLEDEVDAELNDGVLIDEDDLDPFFVEDGQSNMQLTFNDEESWQERSRSFGGLGFRRPGRSAQTRRLELAGRPFRGIGADPSAPLAGGDDVTTHPLLANQRDMGESTDVVGGVSRPWDSGARRHRLGAGHTGGHSGLNVQAFEDIMGENAIRVLESILTSYGSGENFRVSGLGGHSRLLRPFANDHGHDHLIAGGLTVNNTGLGASTSAGAGAGASGDQAAGSSSATPASTILQEESRQTLAILHDFQPMTTADRWNQEGRMLYGNIMTDLASKLTNALLNGLIPLALEEEKKRREAEKRQAEQRRQEELERQAKERKQREEEERKKAEEEERLAAERAAAAAAAAEEQLRQQQELAEAMDVSSSPAPDATEEVTVADESQTDQQQQRTTIIINGEPVDISGTGIDVEFLEALPDDLREEVINQHMREQQPAPQPAEEDSISPEFLDALPPDIREEVLRQEAIERERRERQRRQQQTPQPAQDTAPSPSANNDNGLLSDINSRNLLGAIVRDLDGLRSSSSPGDPLNRLIGRFRQETRSNAGTTASNKKHVGRIDTMQLVDRTQLATLARLLFVPQSISRNLLNKLLLNLCENSKTRGDLLSLLICILHDGSVDLAEVDKSFAQLSLYPKAASLSASTSSLAPASSSSSSTAPAVAGGNSNEPTTSAPTTTTIGENVPNLITQRCLDVLQYVVSSNEQSLTYFLAENDCLAGLKRASSKKGKHKEKDPAKPSSKYPLLVLMSLLDRPVFIENTTLMEQLMNLLATMCRPFPALVRKYVEKVESQKQQPEATSSELASTEAAPAPPVAHKKPVPKPPTIPDHYLKMVVHVLTSGECSSRTFQYTLGVISHLSALDGALQAITRELTEAAKVSGRQILQDLQELSQVLCDSMPGTDIQASIMSPFLAATSHQAKLLRVLKTIDYVYSRKRPSTSSEDDAKEKDEKRVLAIYDQLDFLALWKMLGNCLSQIHEKEEFINVATVLLPLIESFMVVSKYAAGGHLPSTSSTGAVASPGAVTAAPLDSELPEDSFFFKFTEEHKKILNIMVRNNPTLMSGSFSLLVRNPKILEFDNKRNYFHQQLHKRSEPRSHFPPLQLNVRRQYVFEDSYQQLLGRPGRDIKHGKLMVRFYDEEGVDAGGVSREWFSVLARQMFDPNYALFIASAADKLTYQPNRASYVNNDHLSYFKFVGRVIGKAIYDGRLLDAYFTRSFYKHILNRSVDYRDVEAIDPEYYKSLVWMLDNDITDVIDLTFSMEIDDFGTTKTVDLKPGGRDLAVTEANKHEYVNLVTEQKLTIAIRDQINGFLQGFHDIIPPELIQIFNEQELELLISGLPDIDLDDWKNNTTYETYHANSPQVQWFWRAVRSFDQEERAKLLQFSTGTSKVPLNGFSHLQGSGGIQKFQIHKDFGGENRLPSAHTCFNQVDIPEYDSYESLRANLVKAINECATGFAFV
ncbi:hypothetical protein DM01DRAFT_1090162 [Hesseltinella vesiculosa]|uniref:HECT-type E3 ubiquitin transferase n=1 Tax=Hesseltinella vesiculosa TaxID=101127 RepID=A0A1X2GCP2_9FUNG|nr:hypothetical protein DM01DRAFT_1090162 [Hesseltinella vesiculosa]